MSNQSIAQLQELLVGLSAADNPTREKYEAVYEQVWTPQPALLLAGLCGVMQRVEESEATSRSLAAIFFRRIVRKPAPDSENVVSLKRAVTVWERLDVQMQEECCDLLLRAWQGEPVLQVRNKISDAIAEVARIISVHGEWPQLLSMLWSFDASSSIDLICSSLRILTAVPECAQNYQGNAIAAYIAQFFEHPDFVVRLYAVKALNAIITSSSDDRKMAFSPLINKLPDLLGVFAGGDGGSQKEEELTEILQSVVEMADDCPKLFRAMIPRIVPVLIAISKSKTLEDECKSAAVELLTTLCEVMPGTFKKQKTAMIGDVVTLLLELISSNLSETQDWFQQTPDDENDEEAMSLAAEQSLDRVAIALGGKCLLPILTSTIPSMLASSDWRHRYGALRAIANMAEGCADVLTDRLGDFLNLVWPAFKDAHPRVQYAACHALGQLCTDFAGPLQELFAAQCLSSLVGVLVNSTQPRVQCHAAAALINFAEGVDSAIIAPVLGGLFERLVSLLGTSITYLQEQVIATIAAFSSAAGKDFTKHVPQVMPLLMSCLTSTLDKSYRQLQCRALEACSMIALAVEKDAFQEYSKPLLDVMVSLQQSELDSDDMMLDYLPSAWVRMCQVLGSEFSPFVGLVLPRILEEAAAEPDITVIDAADPGAEDEFDHSEWEFATVRGRRLGIHTATLESKCAAVEKLATYIATLQQDFCPYIEQSFTTLLPLIRFNMHEGVQSASAEALASLLKICHQMAQSNPEQLVLVKSMTDKCLEEMLLQLGSDFDAEVTVAILDAIADIISISTPNHILPEYLLSRSFEKINALLTFLVRSQSTATADSGDDEEDGDEDENADDDESIMYGVTRLAGALFKNYREASLSWAETLLQFCMRCIVQNKPAVFKHAALCILDDLVHYLGPHTAPIQEHVSRCLVTGFSDEEADIRQAAIYGIGMCAESAPLVYESFALQSLQLLLKLVESPESRMPSVQSVTDNAMSAVARICKAYPEKIDLATVIPRWIIGLPVTHDEDEVPVVYEWLLSLLSTQSSVVFGSQGQNGALVFRALIEVLVRECSQDPLRSQIRVAALAIKEQLPSAIIDAAISSYTPEQLAKLN